MGKVLSVCVPSYNMEKYLNRCIDSFLVPEILDRLELIIVNDGSTDKTLSIANDYKAKYPQTIVVIDKPNGHYGSCVNASLKVATGKYFRIVDADDWVDSGTLVTFINKLEGIDIDCVCTKFTIHNSQENIVKTIEIDMPSDVDLDMNSFTISDNCTHMHTLTYSLRFLHAINYSQTEGVCYTDTEYVYIPLSRSKSILFIDISLYQYFIGRDNQSMNRSVIEKNFMHFIKVCRRLLLEHERKVTININECFIWSIIVKGLVFLSTPFYVLHGEYNEMVERTLRKSIQTLDRIGICSPRPVFMNRYHGIPYVFIWYYSKWLSKFVLFFFRLLKI
jgi:glycosyltransferase involved in cell wall biosynthesis